MYLMVENKGTCDAEAFTILGVSTTRFSANANTIGKYGSGTKQAICVFLRHHLNPIMFVGNLRLEFFTKHKNIRGVGDESRNYSQVCCRLSGKDTEGRQINRTEDCGFVTEFGELDWTHISMGLREIISNALDASYKETGDRSGMRVEPVADNQVRAKSGHTRVFLPMTFEVSDYYNNICSKFLHFTMGDSVYQNKIMPKKEKGKTKVFRRGVLVGEVVHKDESLFDYNIRELELDESRNMKEGVAHSAAATLLRDGTVNEISEFLRAVNDPTQRESLWEMTFDAYWLGSDSIYDDDKKEEVKNKWQEAWRTTFGHNAAATDSEFKKTLLDLKGYNAILVENRNIFRALKSYDIPMDFAFVTQDEINGIFQEPVTEAVQTVFEQLWDKLYANDLTNGKEKPQLECFRKEMQAESLMLGRYKSGVISINKDIAENDSFALRQTMLEEIVHHVTGSTDMSRDFQDFALRIAITFMDLKG